ncbi:MAG: NmrA family NAD(P)-binding protein [Candidatus Eisenbacteria bacterium]
MFVVTGVTGHTGKVVAETLLAQGQKVRVVVRDSKQGEPWRARGAEVAVASLSDRAAMTAALTGAAGAYLLVPPRYDAADMPAAQRPVVEALAEAVRASAVPHVVLLSSLGAEHAEGTGPIRILHQAERALGAAAKHITFLRAAYFIENYASVLAATAGGVLPTFLTPDRGIPVIATADIGRVAAELLLEPATGTRVVELTSARTWSPADVAAELSATLGRTVTPQFAPNEAVVGVLTGMGWQPGVAELFREMVGGINSGHVAPQGGNVVRRFGQLTPIDVLKPLLAAGVPAHA